ARYAMGGTGGAEVAAEEAGWQEGEWAQYGERVTKAVKSFLATWRPAGGVIRVGVAQESDGWRAFFCLEPEATAQEGLEAMAGRGGGEPRNKGVTGGGGGGEREGRQRARD